MIRLTVDQVEHLYMKMVSATGGDYGIRDRGLLDSALNHVFLTFEGQELYPSDEEKCARICYSIICNHPFVDGNKRMGIFIFLVLLDLNDIKIKHTQADVITLGLGIAERKINPASIMQWVQDHRSGSDQ